MISAIGHVCLSAAVLVAAGTVLGSVAAVRFRSDAALRAARLALGGLVLALTVASAALLTALLRSDFRLDYVVSYTERALPIGYKIAAFWAGQEGSLLLWAWLLAALSLLALPGLRRLTRTEHATAVAVLAIACGFFAAMMLFTADPFAPAKGMLAADGRGLNPMLQDPGMIAHPPLLFLGYAGFTIPFAVLVGVLVSGRRDNHWLAGIRRWIVVSWLFLTAGIVLGAWWAYIELGWGGYWAWDPVENASLLPWLTATGLMHSIMVQQHRGMFKVWNACLIALTFILCIFGTYLTRSGVIDSVHAFAPSLIGSFFLVFLVVCTASSAALIVWRRRALRPEHPIEAVISREGAFLLANALLVLMMVTTLVGTIFPLLSGVVMTDPVSVGPPFYNRVVAPMGLLLVAVMTLGPVLAFGPRAALQIGRRLVVPGAAAVLAIAVVRLAGVSNVWALVCTAIATIGTVAVITAFARSVSARRRSTGEPWALAAVRLVDRDHRRYGGQLAHLGVMMLVVGVAGSSLFKTEEVFRLASGDTARLGDYTLTLESLDEVREVNYTAVRATITLTDGRGTVSTLRPETRFYDTWRDQPNTEVSIRSSLREDLYVSLAGWDDDGRITAIKAHVNPLVLWIWIGGIVMSAGATFCVLPSLIPARRRVRVRQTAPRLEPAAGAVAMNTETTP